MLNLERVELFCEKQWHEMILENSIYQFADTYLKIEDDGTVIISSITTEVEQICCIYRNTYFDDALVLGDTWERAYGDLGWKKCKIDRKMPWYFVAYENNKNYCFGVETLPNAMCSWQCNSETILLNMDVRNGSQGIAFHGEELDVCKIITAVYDGDTHKAMRDFCGDMCKNPRIHSKPIYGGNDWYCNYGKNSFEKIILHAERIAECSHDEENLPYMVVDDGWELCHHPGKCDEEYNGGPWEYCNSNFKDMSMLAKELVNVGVIPGIWFRPLLTVEKVPKECVLKNKGMRLTLDPSSDITLEKVAKDVRKFKEWGYKLIKHDFSFFDIFGKWGFEVGENFYEDNVEFHDKTKTTAQIIKKFYKTIREAAGDDILIMGCNTISHLSAGIFDIQRTGDDTSGIDWERTKKYGINTLAFRMMQHNKFYTVDADCVGITNEIDWEKNRQWLDVLSNSGTVLFVSIAEDAFSEEVKIGITEAFKRASKNTTPSKALDWMENEIPEKWVGVFGAKEYKW